VSLDAAAAACHTVRPVTGRQHACHFKLLLLLLYATQDARLLRHFLAAVSASDELHMLLCLNLARVAQQLHTLAKGKSSICDSSSGTAGKQRRLQVPPYHEQLYIALGLTQQQQGVIARADTKVQKVRPW
jgi:hypothetical protein